MKEMNPRESGRFIAENAEHVTINQDGVKKAAGLIFEAVKAGKLYSSDWLSQEMHPKTRDKSAVDWCFFVDSINFSFWTPREAKFQVTYRERTWTGYFAACACVNRALDDDIPLTDPSYYANIAEGDLESILKGDNGIPMPLMEKRVEVLREVGGVLLEKFDGSFYNLLKKADHSALKLVDLVVENFPCYRDKATYKGKEVAIYKRAQILVADVWRCLDGEGFADFADIDSLTMFADYRIPQVLHCLGALEYSPELLKRLKAEELMESGEEMEVELRGCSIQACELITGEVKQLMGAAKKQYLLPINSIVVDNFLWCHRRGHAEDVDASVPYHRVRTVYY